MTLLNSQKNARKNFTVKPIILILASPNDLHAMAVERHLQEMNAVVHYLRYEELLNSYRIALTFEGGTQSYTIQKQNNEPLDLSACASIWNRRPGQIVTDKFAVSWLEEMVKLETQATVQGMFASLPCLWVNHPRKDQACLQKLWQLKLAADLGMTIPKTLVTNDPELVESFFHDCGGEVVYKLIAENSNHAIPGYENPRGLSTLQLRQQDLAFLQQVQYAPHLFQKRIDKAFELRVTIVGQEIFCALIDSQSGQGKIDWRQDYSVKMEPHRLPETTARQSLELMRKLGLNYGALDYCVTPEGEHIFLEINCAGQFLWMEQRCKLPISLEIAKLLTRQEEPLVHPVSL